MSDSIPNILDEVFGNSSSQKVKNVFEKDKNCEIREKTENQKFRIIDSNSPKPLSKKEIRNYLQYKKIEEMKEMKEKEREEIIEDFMKSLDSINEIRKEELCCIGKAYSNFKKKVYFPIKFFSKTSFDSIRNCHLCGDWKETKKQIKDKGLKKAWNDDYQQHILDYRRGKMRKLKEKCREIPAENMILFKQDIKKIKEKTGKVIFKNIPVIRHFKNFV